MPKHQTTSNIHMARLVVSESPLDATTAATNVEVNIDHEKKPNLRLPKRAAALRKALHAEGRVPSEDEIAQTYTKIVAMVPGYSKKVHSNYFSNKRRGRISGRDTVAAEMENVPNPTMHDLIVWKYTTGLSFEEVFRIVMAKLSDVVKERARTEYMLNSFEF